MGAGNLDHHLRKQLAIIILFFWELTISSPRRIPIRRPIASINRSVCESRSKVVGILGDFRVDGVYNIRTKQPFCILGPWRGAGQGQGGDDRKGKCCFHVHFDEVPIAKAGSLVRIQQQDGLTRVPVELITPEFLFIECWSYFCFFFFSMLRSSRPSETPRQQRSDSSLGLPLMGISLPLSLLPLLC